MQTVTLIMSHNTPTEYEARNLQFVFNCSGSGAVVEALCYKPEGRWFNS
jgi:hypothetical protein